MEESKQTSIQQLQKELQHYSAKQIKTVLDLLHDGNTVPFIARYRKEMTGSLDEVQIREIEERDHYLQALLKRKEEIIRLIGEQDKLTAELEREIQAASVLQQVEDIYRPFKQKKRTKATIAKEQGLQPLADWLLALATEADLVEEATKYLTAEVPSYEAAIDGAKEIIAEQVGDQANYRRWIREYTWKKGLLTSQLKKKAVDEKAVYEMYYEYQEPVNKVVSHRILAVNRGENEGILKITVVVDEAPIYDFLAKHIIGSKKDSPLARIVEEAYLDGYKRFIAPAIEREIRNELTLIASNQAIEVFGTNLRNLLLQAPLKGKVVMGFDPAYRTGCKLAVVDQTGKVLAIEVIYPHKPASQAKQQEAAALFIQLINEYQIDMVAIGNGTASRESEQFVAAQLKTIDRPVYYVIVNEAGASVYSASQVARDEFPDLQVEERSAVSIARRLQDPLAELVKIEPQAVGVGQYQHDLPQKSLTAQLDFVVETTVNQVGVDVNTASPQLLQYVSGLNKTTAQNVVKFRQEIGHFSKRPELKKVPRLGPKAYEQAIGFLRIADGKNILDATPIHPESYSLTEKLLAHLGISLDTITEDTAKEQLRAADITALAKELQVGEPTLADIVADLLQPGRDMRSEMPAPLLRQDVLSMEDLQEGMKLLGTVRNVVDFGAFVDIGVKQDGLVHISKLSERFVKNPMSVVSVGDIVPVWVDGIDKKKGRIALTMIDPTR